MDDKQYSAMFLAYPFCIAGGSIIFITLPSIQHDPIEEINKNTKKMEEALGRLNKISNLLCNSGFIEKAPGDVYLENCKNLVKAEQDFENVCKVIGHLKDGLSNWRETTLEESEDIKNNFVNYKVFQLGSYLFAEKI